MSLLIMPEDILFHRWQKFTLPHVVPLVTNLTSASRLEMCKLQKFWSPLDTTKAFKRLRN